MRLRQLFPLMRASLLALLALGIVVKPVLAAAFELHAIDHAVSTHGDGHGHEHLESDDHQAPGLDGDPDQDDAQGMHGLLHEGNNGGAYSDAIVVLMLPVVSYGSLAVPLPLAWAVPLQNITEPFRPPIA